MAVRNDFWADSSNGHSRLHIAEWLPEGDARGVVQICHGMTEHIGCYERLAAELAADGYIVAGNDHLGHGLTAENDAVDGKPLFLKRAKARELFALLVDRGESGVTSGESIACLWPDKPNSKETQSLFRMTYKRLADALEEEGLGELLISSGTRRALRTDQVDCDLYRILAGDEQTARLYDGQYLQEYSWAEDRNGQLYFMLHRDRV
jgi:hypothetical protein